MQKETLINKVVSLLYDLDRDTLEAVYNVISNFSERGRHNGVQRKNHRNN